jgi:hypothetical protein
MGAAYAYGAAGQFLIAFGLYYWVWRKVKKEKKIPGEDAEHIPLPPVAPSAIKHQLELVTAEVASFRHPHNHETLM